MTATGCDQSARVDLGMGAGYVDDVLVMMVQGGTQWDALCHVYYDEQLWNGFPATHRRRARRRSRRHRQGARRLRVARRPPRRRARAGRRLPRRPATPITTADLEATEARQGVRVGEGDIVMVRTGQMSTVGDFADWSRFRGKEAGLHWETAAWLHERRVAAVAADNSMVEASAQIPGVWVPFHMLALCNLGLHLGEFWYLEALARDCAADGVWECLLVAQALPIAGGSGSPVNPIAMK